MKFYDRDNEIETLQAIENRSKKNAQMTVMMGRRRVGKTELLKHSFISTPILYLFVEKKTETLLCEEFVQEIQSSLGVSVFGEYKRFKSLFAYLMELSKTQNFTLIIDEFQEFRKINPSIFSEIDIIAINEMEKRLCFYEVKRNKSKISLPLLENKAKEIVQKFPDYYIEYLGLSLEDL